MTQKDTRKKYRANSLGQQWWRNLSLPRRGKKESLLSPVGRHESVSDSQFTKIEKRKARLRKAVSAPRASRKKHLATAIWCFERGMAQVVRPRGNSMQSMGVFEGGKQWLFPEEAVYLVDRAQLDLCVSGVPVSLQRAWGLLFEGPNAISLDEFCAFSHLRRIGYVVRRPNLDKIVDSADDVADGEAPASSGQKMPLGHQHVNGFCDGPSETEEGAESSPDLRVSFSAWRVGAYKRRDTHRPLFNLLVWRYADDPPRHAQLTSLLESFTGKTRLRAALIDRGVVVLIDIANKATPLSARYRKRLESSMEGVVYKHEDGHGDLV